VIKGNGKILRKGTWLNEARKALIGARILMPRLARWAAAASQDKRRYQAIPDGIFRARSRLNDGSAILMARNLPRFDARVFARPTMPIRTAHATGKYFEHDAILRTGWIGDLLQ
jgi:hypothetical protein